MSDKTKNKAKKELLVSISQPGRKTESITVKNALTLGKDYASDIRLDIKTLPDSYVFLKRRKRDRFTLKLVRELNALLRKGKELLSIKTLSEVGIVEGDEEFHLITLSPGMSMELVIGTVGGDAVINFNYRDVPGLPKAHIFIPFISSREYLFLVTLIISAILHASFAYYLSTIEIKRKKTVEEAMTEIQPRFARLILKEKPVEKKVSIVEIKETEEKMEKRKKTDEELIKGRMVSASLTQKKPANAKKMRQEAEVYRVVRSYIGGLKYLYNNTLRKDPTLRGTLTVRFVITPDGRVSKAIMEKTTLNNAQLEESIIERIHHWRFQVLEDGEDFTINYTFDFSPVG